jgi:ABC-type Mn2+/Zn2+ transport system permease subunit
MMEMLGYHFMQRALFAGTLIGVVCAVIGTYIVLKGLSFIGAGIAHASFGGVALGFLLKVNPVLTAVFFCLGTAWGIGLVTRKSGVKEDTAVGIFFASTMAFGSILAVSQNDVWITLGLSATVLLLVLLFFKESAR